MSAATRPPHRGCDVCEVEGPRLPGLDTALAELHRASVDLGAAAIEATGAVRALEALNSAVERAGRRGARARVLRCVAARVFLVLAAGLVMLALAGCAGEVVVPDPPGPVVVSPAVELVSPGEQRTALEATWAGYERSDVAAMCTVWEVLSADEIASGLNESAGARVFDAGVVAEFLSGKCV